MKLTRQQATMMFDNLGLMALGHLSEEMLEVVINNYNALGRVASDLRTLNEELHRRMYSGMDEQRVNGMFRFIVDNRMAEARTEFPDLWPIFEKHNNLSKKISLKEVDVDIEKVDSDEFIKGILKGKKDAPVSEIKQVFAPMFVPTNHICDMSELDDIMR